MEVNAQEVATIIGNYFQKLEEASKQVLEDIGAPDGAAYIAHILYRDVPNIAKAELTSNEAKVLKETKALCELEGMGINAPEGEGYLYKTKWLLALANFIGFYLQPEQEHE